MNGIVRLPPEAVDEFRQLYQKITGEELPADKAHEEATICMTLFLIHCKIPVFD